MKPKSILCKSIATLILAGVTLQSSVHALPLGEQVQAGTASFQRAGSVLSIQTSDRAIINYQSFGIGVGERVSFVQPSANSITLNRVTSANPSYIFGTLQANGHIVLANPYGIFFENGSVVNVGGLIAGAGHISNADFLAGRMNFTGLTGDVENRGRIIAIDDVGLYGAHVSNEGVISSQKGSVTLGAGSSVYVGEKGGNIFVNSSADIPKARVVSSPKPGVKNSGSITAPKVMLATGDMYGIAIAQSGVIKSGDISIAARKGGTVDVSGRLDASNRAPGKSGGKIKIKGDTVAVHDATLDASGAAGGGLITLDGGHNSTTPTTVTSSGAISARGEGSGAKGGTVEMLGDHVGLLDKAVVDVSGNAGGGTALIGGDYQGKNPNIQNATATYVSPTALINADAIQTGDGGKVIVWANDTTRFYGTISARGGVQSGNGGFVETSGKAWLDFNGRVNASAPRGLSGMLLLDPSDINIYNGVDSLATGTFVAGIFSGATSPASISWSTIRTQLNSNSVIITTTGSGGSGNITIGAAPSPDLNSGNNLALLANNNITLSAGIKNTGGGDIKLVAGWNGVSTSNPGVTLGAGTIDLGSNTISAGNGANLVLAAGNSIIGSGTLSNSGNTPITLSASSGSIAIGTVTSARNITLTAGTDITVNTKVTTGGSRTIAFNFDQGGTGGTLDLSALTMQGGTPTLSAGTITALGSGGTSTLKAPDSANTWNLTGSNAGNINSSAITFTQVGNLTDSGAAVFNMHAGADGSVSGNLSAVGGTVDYTGYSVPVTFHLGGASGLSTGIGGTWSGITVATGSSASDTIAGASQNYRLTGANAGNNGTVFWTSFEKVADSGSGTITTVGGQTYNLTGANAGNVATLLPGGFTGIGNLTDSGAAVFNMHAGADGSVSGNLSAVGGTVDYTGYSVPVTFHLGGASGLSTGIGGTWSGITVATGSGGSDTIAGASQNYRLTGANAGNNGTVFWTSFEKVADTGTGTISTIGGQTYNLTGADAGNVATLLPGGFTGIGNLTDSGAGIFNMHVGADGSVSGNLSAVGGTVDYTGYSVPVTFHLGGASGLSTGIGGTWSGITVATGSSASDTIAGASQNYRLTGANAGNNGTVFWTSFEKVADSVTGTITTSGGQTYNLTGANAGNVATLLPGGFTGIGNLTDSGAAVFNMHAGADGSVSGNLSAVGGTVDYTGYSVPVTFHLGGASGLSTGIGGTWSGITVATGSSASDTIAGASQNYRLTGANAGNNGTVSWTSFEKVADSGNGTITTVGGQTYNLTGANAGNVATLLPGGFTGIGNLTDSGAAVFNMHAGADGSVSGNLSAVGGTVDYTGYSVPVTFHLGGASGLSTGIGGTWSGITVATGSGASDTIAGASQNYRLTGANAGNNGTVFWTSFENLTDSGAAVFNMHVGADGSVSGNLSAVGGTVDYTGYSVPVTFHLGGASGLSTGIGGTWSGITVATGSSASDTIAGASQNYHLTGANAGNNGTVFWTSFEKVADSVTGTITTSGGQTYNLTGANAGNVATLLPGGFTGIGNLTDSGAAVFNMHAGADGSVSGNLSAVGGTVDYTGYSVPVTFHLGGASGLSTGIGGTWSGITVATGSGGSDTIKGASQNYRLTGANAGNNGTVSWTSFEKVADSGNGTITTVGGQTYNLTGANAGNVATLLPGGFTGIGNLTDSGAAVFNMHAGADGSVSGNLSAVGGTVDYTGYSVPVTFHLGGASGLSTGIGGTWSGITVATGSSASDTIAGASQNYHLTGANAGNNGTVFWTSFEKVADSVTGTITTVGGQTYNLTGANAGNVATLLPGGFTGIGNLTDSGAAVFNMHVGADGSVSGNLSAVGGTVDYTGYSVPVTFHLGGASGLSTGIGGTWSGITAATGSSASDTIAGASQNYRLTGANAGNNGTVFWTSFENLTDSGAGIFNMHVGADGSVSGNLSAVGGTVDYTGYSVPVTFHLGGASGLSTGIGGTWSGITVATGSGGSDTIKGASQNYRLTGANAGNNGTVSWTSFEKVADSGNGTITTVGGQTYNLTGANAGNVATLLPGGFTGIGNLTDSGAAVFNMHAGADGSVSGNLSAVGGTVDYTGYSVPVTFHLGGASGLSTGIGGTWSGITVATGSSASDTIAGASQNYHLTGANAGNNGTVFWTSFEKVADSVTGTITTSGGQTYNLTGANAGNVATLLPGGFTGIGNLTDSGAAVFNMHVGADGSVSGNLSAVGGTLDYTAYTTAVSVNLQTGAATGIGGTFSNITAVTGPGGKPNTLTGANVANTWNITASDSGTVGGVTFTAFPNLTGGTNTDSFTLSGGTLSGAVNGMSGSNTLAGSTTFIVTGADSGAAAGIGGGFTNIGNLTGTTGADTFTLNGGTLSGAVKGVSGNDTLIGSTSYNVTGANSGSAVGVAGGFTNIGNLTGTAGSDTFSFNSGSLTGNVDGGGAAAGDALKIASGSATIGGTVKNLGSSGSVTVNTSGTATFQGEVDATSLVVTQSGGTTFQSILKPDTTTLTATLTDTTGTIAFQGNTHITTLNTANKGYNVSFTGATNTVDNAATLLNTGTVTLVNGTNSTTFTGGMDTSGGPVKTTIGGNLNTTNAQMKLGPTTLTADATLNSAGGNVTFNSALDGGFGLAVNSGAGTTTFSGVVGGIAKLASITTDAPGGTTINTTGVTTTGSQTFADPVTLTANAVLSSSGAGSINLLSTVAGGGHALTLSTAGNATLGASLLNLSGFAPNVFGMTTITGPATAISVSAIVNFVGPVTIGGNVSIKTTTAVPVTTKNGKVNVGTLLKFSSSVDGAGNLAVESDGELTFSGGVGQAVALGSLTAKAPIIDLSSTQTVGNLTAHATVASGGDGSDGLLRLTGGSYHSQFGSVFFNETDRMLVSSHATILDQAGGVAISAPFGDFQMGNGQKLLVSAGALAISAGSQAVVGDLAASGGLTVDAPTIFLHGRPPVSGLFNEHRQDGGLGFVAPTIAFRGGGGVGLANIAFVTGTTQKATFSTVTSVASVRQVNGISIEVDKDQANQFNGNVDVGARDSITGVPVVANLNLGFIQPIASGVKVTQPGDARISFVIEFPKRIEIPDDTSLSNATLEALRRLGIDPRIATSDENISISLHKGVFTQPIEGKAEMAEEDYKVVLNRLTKVEAIRIAEAYLRLAGDNFEHIAAIAASLAVQVNNFHTEKGPQVTGLTGFGEWLLGRRSADEAADKLVKNLDQLAGVFANLSKVGLTKKEIAICKMKVLGDLGANLSNVQPDDLLLLIGDRPKTAVPAPLPGMPPVPAGPLPPAETPLPPPPDLTLPPEPAPGGGTPATPAEKPKDSPKPDADPSAPVNK